MQGAMQKYLPMMLKFQWLPFLLLHLFFQYSNMRYDKNGFPVKEYYIEELKKPIIDKIKAEKNQKYYTGGAIILMFVVLIGMYLVLN